MSRLLGHGTCYGEGGRFGCGAIAETSTPHRLAQVEDKSNRCWSRARLPGWEIVASVGDTRFATQAGGLTSNIQWAYQLPNHPPVHLATYPSQNIFICCYHSSTEFLTSPVDILSYPKKYLESDITPFKFILRSKRGLLVFCGNKFQGRN